MPTKLRIHALVSKLRRAFCSSRHSCNRSARSGVEPDTSQPQLPVPIPEITARYRDFYASLADDHRSDLFQSCLPVIIITPPSQSNSTASSQASTYQQEADSRRLSPPIFEDDQLDPATTAGSTARPSEYDSASATRSSCNAHGTSKRRGVRFDDTPPDIIVIPEHLVTIVETDSRKEALV